MSDKINPNDFLMDDDVINGINLSTSGNELPFPCPTFWWVNGSRQAKNDIPPMYFGGWSANAEDVESAAQAQDIDSPNIGLYDSSYANTKGEVVSVLMCRSILCAPLAIRDFWEDVDGGRTVVYRKGTKHKTQMLVLLLQKIEGEDSYIPWAPIMLTARGRQADNLLKAPQAWDTYLRPHKLRHGISNTPSWAFAMALGSYGKEPFFKEEKSADGRASSFITPITLFKPEITPELLSKLFIGKTFGKLMLDYRNQAEDWLNAYKEEADSNSDKDGDLVDEIPF